MPADFACPTGVLIDRVFGLAAFVHDDGFEKEPVELPLFVLGEAFYGFGEVGEGLWLIFGAPDDELLPSEGGDIKDFYPVDPTQLPMELGETEWPPKDES